MLGWALIRTNHVLLMGRVKRYKKLKSCDPFYRGLRKLALGKNEDLAPCAKEMEQPLPKSFQQLMEGAIIPRKRTRKEEVQNDVAPRTAKKKKGDSTPEAQTDAVSEPLPKFKRRKGESMKDYVQRLESETCDRVLAAQKVQKASNEKNKRYHQMKKLKQQLRKKGVSLSDFEDVSKLDFTDLKDHVKFREVAKAPPKLANPSQQARDKHAKRTGLLLSTRLRGGEEGGAKKVIGLHREYELQKERERVISDYKSLKQRTKTKE